MEAASAIVSLPLTAISALDNIVNSLREMGPDAQVAKWTSSADEMIQRVHMIQKDIPVDAMGHFLEICSVYVARRNAYIERMENGGYQGLWLGSNRRKGRRDAQELVSAAGATAQQASRISSTALLTRSRMLTGEVLDTHNSDEPTASETLDDDELSELA